MLKQLKKLLKFFVPPPTRTFLREITSLRQLITNVSAQHQKMVAEAAQQTAQHQKVVTEVAQQTASIIETQQTLTNLIEENRKQIERMFSKLEEQSVCHAQMEKDIMELNKQLQQQKQYVTQQIDKEKRALFYEYCCRLPQEQYEKELSLWYRERTGKKLNLAKPKTFNEKIQWIKLYDSTPLKTKLADKYLAQRWVESKIGKQYLISLLGEWDNFDEINFDELPKQFVLKANHGSGYNVIVTDKDNLNKSEVKKKFEEWMKRDFAFAAGFEMHYTNISPKIIAEEYYPCEFEYQFWCFNGCPKFVSVVHEPHGRNLKATYNLNWERLDFVTSLPILEEMLPVPYLFEKMAGCAEIMCKDFIFVRVDFFHDGAKFFLMS